MRYDSTTGLSRAGFAELFTRVQDILESRGIDFTHHLLQLAEQLEISLIALRNNISQMLIADLRGISQPTVSRICRRMAPLISEALCLSGITLQDAINDGHLILVDGTYIPTGNRPASGEATEKANYSGKHHVQFLGVQVAATDTGQLLVVSEPVPGSRHDAKALELTGWNEILNQPDVIWVADSAYIRTTAVTPTKKRPGQDRLEWEKEYNRDISSIRAHIEHAIADLKKWNTLATGYRGRLRELPAIIRIITKLELYRQGW